MAAENLRLYTICFLDALSIGFFAPILATHIISLEGNHTVLGTLATFYATFQLFSGPLIRTWIDLLGKQTVLLATLFVNFITYIPLGLTSSYVIVVLLRLTCGLTNQTQTVCKAMAAQLNPKEKHDSVNGVMSAVTVAGFVIGPVVGGLMFDYENGFYHISLLATAMLAMSLLIALKLPRIEETKTESTRASSGKMTESITHSLNKLKSVSFEEQWDVVLSKYLYSTSTTVYFIKFSMLLKLNYGASSADVGYTYAYQSMLTFLSHFVIAFLKQLFAKDSTNLTISSLFIATTGFLGLCYAPSYDTYLASFIPMILAHTMLNSSWKQLFALRSMEHHKIEGLDDTLNVIASIVTPIVFGYFCDLYGHYALKTFVILPLIVALGVTVVFSPKTVKPRVSQKED